MRGIRGALKPEGTYLVQEINISGDVKDNIRPMGKMVYSVSTLYCMTTSLSHGGAGIGAAMGEEKARELATQPASSNSPACPSKMTSPSSTNSGPDSPRLRGRAAASRLPRLLS